MANRYKYLEHFVKESLISLIKNSASNQYKKTPNTLNRELGQEHEQIIYKKEIR